MGVRRNGRLDVLKVAHHLDVSVLDFHKLPLSDETKKHLCNDGQGQWSALALQIGGVNAVVINPCQSPARKVSNLAHEISHLLRAHRPAQIIINPTLQVSMRTYNAIQENEAVWLSGCLLLPRVALLHAQSRGWDDEQICQHFCISPQMLLYRRNVTGLGKRIQKVVA